MTTFINREHAGSLLYNQLKKDNVKADLVIALPRGGIPIGSVIADKLNISLRLIYIRKIGHPANPEYAIGAVSESDLLLNEASHYGVEFLKREIVKERNRIAEMKNIFQQPYANKEIQGKDILLVDDGIATGTCIQLAIKELRENGAGSIHILAPVCPYNTYPKIQKIADRITCLLVVHNFLGIGAYYIDFNQLTDELVTKILHRKKLPEKVAFND